MELCTIGQFAKINGVNVETVRFYERIGLIPQPSKPVKGFRMYSDEEACRIKFIKKAKDLGFTLSEIEQLMSLREKSDDLCSNISLALEKKIEDIERKVESYQNILNLLRRMHDACQGPDAASWAEEFII